MEIKREEIQEFLEAKPIEMYANITIQEAREYLDAIEKKGVKQFSFNEDVSAEAYITRLETDEEYNKRVNTRKQMIAQKDKRDRALFEELKARYESETEQEKATSRKPGSWML